ncbi:phage tail protein [Kiloniella litopenaei]|uniref:phage tail protein n=1 Tax=Kiloniella litopenaei TaxID=1549748 RepID=UPI003BAB134F
MVMMALGNYRFSMDTAAYDKLRRENDYNWVSVQRLGAETSQQYLGEGDETITLDGVIYPHFKGGLNQVSDMRAQASTGEAFLMVDGRGKVWGKYAIKKITEEQSRPRKDSAPLKIDFSLILKRYGGDDG